MAICERQAARLLSAPLDDLAAEDRDALRAGLATAGWITVDAAAARRAREDGVTTRPGDDRCAALRTGASKPREAFLALPRAGCAECVIDAAARAQPGWIGDRDAGDASGQALRQHGRVAGASRGS